MSTGDILLFLRLGLHLVVVLLRSSPTSEGDTVFEDTLKIVVLSHRLLLMMEQPHTCERHCDAILIARHDHMVIAY